jgi:diguanylate cyclase (GGDEF)-like protein/PAS domain S-box-containing protein
LTEEAQAGGKGGVGEPGGTESRPVVLVADDDATTRLLLKEALEAEGFTVEEAADGLEAVERFVSVRPDLVVLDAQMPVMDGCEACAKVRERPEGELTPILMLAGRDDFESIGRACDAGATDFATKPFNRVVLGHRVRFMLRAQRALVDLRQSEARLARAQRIARLGHWEWDAGSGQVSWSREVHTIFGTDPAGSVPTLEALLELVDAPDRDAVRQHRQEAIERGTAYAVDLRVGRPDGTTRFVHEQVEALLGAAGEVRGLWGTVQDVTERRETEARLRFLARHDALTELPNRGFFVEQVSSTLARLQRHGGILAVLMVDIDQFKRFNDTLGHGECDQLLRDMAGRLRACLRLSDPLARDAEGDGRVTLARPGGDEFLAAVTDIEGPSDAARAGQRILEALREPFRVRGQEVVLTASIGISLFPQDASDAETLITRAASALSHAPDPGWSRYRFFDETTHSAALGRVTLEGQLRLALERDELRLHYQPLVDARTGALVALEALARWPHPERGMVPPGEFIPLAEETGLIDALGDWVLNATYAQIDSWRAAGYEPPPVAINLSAVQFHQPGLAAKLAKAARDRSLAPGCLEIEITESVLMRNTDRALETLRKLKEMGLRIAVDDFGTGYSSLAYLRRFPFDSLKIDRTLVSEAVDRSDAASIALAILALAHSLELSTVAEGVETEEQAAFFSENGCRTLQGYLFARALPPDELIPFLDGSKTLMVAREGAEGHPSATLGPTSKPH